jgi:endonuclease-3
MVLTRRVAAVLEALEAAYGRPTIARPRPPIDELILTILSQNTSDTNRDRAWRSLRRLFPSWEAARKAPRARIEAAIRAGGLARVKSRVIQEVLRSVHAQVGGIDLGFLRDLPQEEAKAWLRQFRGVGDKTAACVLLFSCGLPVFPVDTHIHRVTRRLGWIGPDATAAEAHRALAGLIPPHRCLTAHVNFITLGRQVCRPQRPRCPSCPLRRCCPYAAKAS